MKTGFFKLMPCSYASMPSFLWYRVPCLSKNIASKQLGVESFKAFSISIHSYICGGSQFLTDHCLCKFAMKLVRKAVRCFSLLQRQMGKLQHERLGSLQCVWHCRSDYFWRGLCIFSLSFHACLCQMALYTPFLRLTPSPSLKIMRIMKHLQGHLPRDELFPKRFEFLPDSSHAGSTNPPISPPMMPSILIPPVNFKAVTKIFSKGTSLTPLEQCNLKFWFWTKE